MRKRVNLNWFDEKYAIRCFFDLLTKELFRVFGKQDKQVSEQVLEILREEELRKALLELLKDQIMVLEDTIDEARQLIRANESAIESFRKLPKK